MSHTQSIACCNTPAVISKGYKEKGKYIDIDGLKTYTTGPSSASKGILVIYDIFGFFPQTIQGADIIAHSGNQHYQVFMPDLFDGNPADISWYPPDTEEKGKKLGEFFQTEAAPPKTVERVGKVMNALQSSYPDIKNWGVVGYCWGGKVGPYNNTITNNTKDLILISLSRLLTWSRRREPHSKQQRAATLQWWTPTMHLISRFLFFQSHQKMRTGQR